MAFLGAIDGGGGAVLGRLGGKLEGILGAVGSSSGSLENAGAACGGAACGGAACGGAACGG